MKNVCILFFLFCFAGIMMSCSNSEADSSDVILGTWELQKSMTGIDDNKIIKGETLIKFQEDGQLLISSKSSYEWDAYFLPTGNYRYNITSNVILISGDPCLRSFEYQTDNNILELHSIESEPTQYSYPGPTLHYTFYRR
jgi:hypothetical protein